MITKTDWQEINQLVMSEDRARLGAPPTSDEVLQYMRGELSLEQEERVRELLVCYPELLRALTAPFPEEGAKPGDPDYVSDDEFRKHWEKMEARMSRRVVQFWRVFGAIAATVAVVFGAMLWRAETALRYAQSQPRVAWDQEVLLPDGQRGPETSATIAPRGESLLLVVPIVGSSFDQYRIEAIDARHADHPRWKSPTMRHGDNSDAFYILVPRSFLAPGKYQFLLIGVSGARQEQVASYSVRVQ